jgi:hypothetical protein
MLLLRQKLDKSSEKIRELEAKIEQVTRVNKRMALQSVLEEEFQENEENLEKTEKRTGEMRPDELERGTNIGTPREEKKEGTGIMESGDLEPRRKLTFSPNSTTTQNLQSPTTTNFLQTQTSDLQTNSLSSTSHPLQTPTNNLQSPITNNLQTPANLQQSPASFPVTPQSSPANFQNSSIDFPTPKAPHTSPVTPYPNLQNKIMTDLQPTPQSQYAPANLQHSPIYFQTLKATHPSPSTPHPYAHGRIPNDLNSPNDLQIIYQSPPHTLQNKITSDLQPTPQSQYTPANLQHSPINFQMPNTPHPYAHNPITNNLQSPNNLQSTYQSSPSNLQNGITNDLQSPNHLRQWQETHMVSPINTITNIDPSIADILFHLPPLFSSPSPSISLFSPLPSPLLFPFFFEDHQRCCKKSANN